MCKGCKMDPREMAKFRERQGAVDVDDFYKEVNYQTRMKGRGGMTWGRASKRRKNKAGCPSNNYGPHIYVWTTEGQEDNFFSDYYGFFKYEYETCCGCGKTRKSRKSEQYEKVKARKWAKKYGDEYSMKRGEPVGRFASGRTRYSWWNWESYDEDYMEARQEYFNRRGFTSYYYNGW